MAAQPPALELATLTVSLPKGLEVSGYVQCEGQPGWDADDAALLEAAADALAIVLVAGLKRDAETALRSTEERFRLLAEGVGDLVCLHDWHGRFLWLSPSCLTIIGYEREELTNVDLFHLVHPDDVERVREALWIPMRMGGRAQPTTYRVRRKDGSYTWLETVAERVVRDGDVLQLQTSSREVTERVAVEEALALNEERYRTVVENTIDGIALIDVRTLQVLEANSAFQTMLGYSLPQLRALTLAELTDRPLERLRHTAEEVFNLRRAYRGEITFIRKDGRRVETEAHAHVITDRRGPVVCAVIRDVTARKRSEQLQADRARALEFIAKSEPLDETLRHLTHMIERHRTGLHCTFLLRMDDGRWQGPGDGLGSGPAPNAGVDRFSAPIVSASGERLGIFIGRCLDHRSLTVDDMAVVELACTLGAIAIEQDGLGKRLAHQSQHDELTGLPNRRLFEDRLQQGLAVAARHGTGLALLFVDLDAFKRINDTLGHDVGDLLLREVASRLDGMVRTTDTVARMGGDEFMVILTDIATPIGATHVAQQILDLLRLPFEVSGHELHVSASIGISLYPQDALDASRLQRHADLAMYRVKGSGRDGFRRFTPDLTDGASERLQIETYLRYAMEKNELELCYQPEIGRDGGVSGVEALLRWEHPRLGRVPPARFIPIAEECGLIVPIGTWVMRQACKHFAEWVASGTAPDRLAINVSPLQFQHHDFVNLLAEIIEETGVDPGRIELELTEGTLIRDFHHASEKLTQLREIGVSIAIDDFGTGYSSLSYLHRLPIDTLKIDQSFVRDIESTSSTLALVEAICALARSLRLGVVAEGVETETQLEVLRGLGCDRIQGYLIGRAVPASDVPGLVDAAMGIGLRSVTKLSA